MADETPAAAKTDLINQILDIELDWFLNVNPTITADCQRNPDAFKLMRGSNFETWSEKTLALYLTHLHDSRSEERNLVREKYAKMQGSIPCQNSSQTLTDNLEIQQRWNQEAREKYPHILRQGDESGFAWYLRCELDTYSPAVLESYLQDLKAAVRKQQNLVIETYERIAQKLGHASLDDWHRQKEGRS